MTENFSKKQLREFGLLIGFGLPIFLGWIIPSILGHTFRLWTLWVGIPSLMISILKPRLLFYPYKGCIAIGQFLASVNSSIILGLVFLLVLQPTAFIMRLFGYDPLRKKKGNQKSYREIKKGRKIDLTRIF